MLKCDRDKSTGFNVNNTISDIEQKQLLIIINDGGNDFVDKKSIDGISKKYFNTKNNKSLSGGIIALIIVLFIIFITIILLMIIFRKKLFKNELNQSQTNHQLLKLLVIIYLKFKINK